MPYRGHIQNGVVHFDDAMDLPDGTVVEVYAATPMAGLSERWKDLIGVVSGLPDDMAQNHNHYIHGTPKNK